MLEAEAKSSRPSQVFGLEASLASSLLTSLHIGHQSLGWIVEQAMQDMGSSLQ